MLGSEDSSLILSLFLTMEEFLEKASTFKGCGYVYSAGGERLLYVDGLFSNT